MPQKLTTQEAVIAELTQQIEHLSPQLQQCARYIIDHPREVGLESMRSLAASAEVNPNSFVRLAKQLGFDGYEQLRERFRDFVRGGSGSFVERAVWLQQLAQESGDTAVVGEMADATLDNLEQMYQQQEIEQLERAVEQMIGAERVFVLGIGLAYPLAYNLWYLARQAFDHFILTPRHGSLPSDDMVRIGRDDCLVAMTFQPYRIETVRALEHATKAGASTIAITDSPGSSVYRIADLGLAAPTHTPQFFQSNVALTALVETLSALLVAKGGAAAAESIDAFNTARWEANIYVDY